MSSLLTADDLVAPARAALAAQRAEADLSVYEWADRHLLVPRGTGLTNHDSALTPYWRRWLRTVRARTTYTPSAPGGTDHLVERISIISGTQVGKTFGFLVPTLAWIVAVHPRDLGLVLPSHDSAKDFAKKKLDRAFRGSPRLASLLPAGAAEDAKRRNVRGWLLDRCTLHFLNGSVALHLRQNDLPVAVLDEFDALPADCDGEGSPLRLLDDRQKTFPHSRLRAGITTPTIVSGLGWASLVAGTHERLLVACCKCGAHAWLDPDLLEPTATGLSPDTIELDDAARWRCPRCGHRHTSDDRDRMVAAACAEPGFTAAGGWCPGTWQQRTDGSALWTPACSVDAGGRVQRVDQPRSLHHSGWLNSLYSRFVTLGAFLGNEQRARAGSAEDRQGFANGWRAEPFLAQVDGASAEDVDRIVLAGAESGGYLHGQCPTPAWRVVLTCDQQGDTAAKSWFPYVCRAWREDGSSALVEAGRVTGFDALTNLTQRTWAIGGAARGADVVAVDTANGTVAPDLLRWIAVDPRRRLSIAGSGTMSPEDSFSWRVPGPRTVQNFHGVPIRYWINSNRFRDLLYERMRGADGQPAWLLPADAPDWYRASLTAEERVPGLVVVRGRKVPGLLWRPRAWVDPQGRTHPRHDNHWFDCEVMQVAVVTVLAWYDPTPRSTVNAAAYVASIARRSPR